ncbi:Hypothetical protein R9X50_00417500 [Acrodontium crateriforme]|uniref:Heterokaryon incompatibility domain-containing protein n=1 Tax=Acrodontium crateriforme TaxID=150365 RepID=A0AAQ3R858_9PEZI|nr:Hypothetical protein R9X50_00417500 [Acrodontium crateriforme]
MKSFRSSAKNALQLVSFAGKAAELVTKEVAKYVERKASGRCAVCNNLQLNAIGDVQFSTIRPRTAPDDGTPPAPTLTIATRYPKDLLKMRETAKQYSINPEGQAPCKYCLFLAEIFDAFFIDEWMSWITETHNAMSIDFGLKIKQDSPLVIDCHNFTYDPGAYRARVDLEMFVSSDALVNLPGMPVVGVGVDRSKDSSDLDCQAFIKHCMRQCCGSHTACNESTKSSFVPTRLLRVSQAGDEVYLVESSNIRQPVSWAALSHCWGKAEPLKLLPENKANFMVKIPGEKLPATFRDSIAICKLLNLEYLWIDSLCIVQGNKEEWEVESARMQGVYADALVVIVAASSESPDIPYLGPRDEEWHTKTFNFSPSSDISVPISVRRRHILAPPLEQGRYEPPFTDAWALKRSGPLYKRAWCFQEAHLAKRAIHFTPGSIIFECRTHRRSEAEQPPYQLTHLGSLGDVSDSDQWHAMVKSYTSRELTYASDKLPAISGLAASMPQSRRSQYLAGLWKESLVTDMLWQVLPGPRGLHYSLTYLPSQQSAPTWSWVSVNRAVTWNRLQNPESLAEVVGAQCVAGGENAFGAVAAGAIQLKGRLRPCHVSYKTNKGNAYIYCTKTNGIRGDDQHFNPDGLLLPDSTSGNIRRARFNESKGDFDAPAFFLCMARTPWMNYNYVGIVIAPSNRITGAYERLGNMTNLGSDWYTKGQETVVTLI